MNSSDAAVSLAAYLQTLNSGTVLVGVTAFDPATGLLNPALDSLSALGVSVNDVPIQGSFAFVAQQGASPKTVLKKSYNITDTAVVLNAHLAGKKYVTHSAALCEEFANRLDSSLKGSCMQIFNQI
jgi:hypothetical protein